MMQDDDNDDDDAKKARQQALEQSDIDTIFGDRGKEGEAGASAAASRR